MADFFLWGGVTLYILGIHARLFPGVPLGIDGLCMIIGMVLLIIRK